MDGIATVGNNKALKPEIMLYLLIKMWIIYKMDISYKYLIKDDL